MLYFVVKIFFCLLFNKRDKDFACTECNPHKPYKVERHAPAFPYNHKTMNISVRLVHNFRKDLDYPKLFAIV
jgi:hypothetical protein